MALFDVLYRGPGNFKREEAAAIVAGAMPVIIQDARMEVLLAAHAEWVEANPGGAVYAGQWWPGLDRPATGGNT